VSAEATTGAVTGGADAVIYRTLSIHLDKGKTCVIDYVQRLALGAHEFSGSSLQSYMFESSDFQTGKRTLSIPVQEISPQQLRKDMTASRGSDHIWDIRKSPSPAELSFTNTCSTDASARQAGVAITVTWEKRAATASGPATIITHIYAKNPAARTITVNVTDRIYAGTTQTTELDSATAGPVDVPANTELLVLTHTFAWTSPTDSSANDVATATYTDKQFPDVTIPGQTQASANAPIQLTGTELNQSAVVNDIESISGSGFSYSADSFSGASGAFDNGYVAGTHTTSSVSWTSATQTGSGSVTLNKTVYVASGTAGTGSLSDTATITGSDGFTAQASAGVDLSASRLVSLRITKNIPNVLQGSETQSFTFDVYDDANTKVATKTISFSAGETQKSADVTGLAPGSYTVKEQAASGWQAQDDQVVDLSTRCSDTATFTNRLNLASAAAVKVTDPSGNAGGWTMVLTGPGTPTGGEQVVTNSSGNASFLTQLQEGSYTITEVSQTGWTQTGTSGDCSFTVSYPADAGRTFTCTITNRSRGAARVVKTVNGAAPTGTQAFIFQLRTGASATQSGTIVESLTANAGNGGIIAFTTQLVPGTTYQLCEIVMPGWLTSFGTFVPNSFIPPDGVAANPNVDNSILCGNFTVGFGETKTFTIDNTPPPGGRALTIGFWKNWASCSGSNGKQRPVLDQTLAAGDPTVLSASSGTYPGFGGTIYLALHSGDCTKAVNLLNKSTMSGGKKMASDPIFNMTAQLLAAELNYTAGAGKNGTTTTNINQAVLLNGKYGFNGNTYSPKLSQADTAKANCLATQLDNYNNDRAVTGCS